MWGCRPGAGVSKSEGAAGTRKERVKLAARIITRFFEAPEQKGVFWEMATNLGWGNRLLQSQLPANN